MDELVIPALKETQKLIFLFHGYGADKNNMQPIGERFAEVLPNAEVHIPNGVEFCTESHGFKWFSMNSDNLKDWESEFARNVPQITNYVDSVKSIKNLNYSDIIFSGFSQGAMLSLSLGIHYNVKAIIAFSGMILSPEKFLKHAETKVLLAHGANDSVIPVSAVDFTKSALRKFNVDTKVAIAQGLDHAINGYLLDQAVDFLQNL